MLNADELERYARHIVLREVGGPGQTALQGAKVLVIGAGGLGAPALMYLAAAGIGTLAPTEEAGTPADVALLEEIRDLLKTRGGAV